MWNDEKVEFALLHLGFGCAQAGIMFYTPAISELLLRLSRAWKWLHGGLHFLALPLLPFSLGHEQMNVADPDFWTT